MERTIVNKADNTQWTKSIFSDGTNMFVNNQNPKYGDTVEIKIRMLKGSPIEKVYIRYLRNGEETLNLMELAKEESQGKFQYYKVSVKLDIPTLNYHFIILTADKTYFYNQLGLTEYIITEDYDFRIIADFESSEWVKNAVFYQIFVDRFFNGDLDSDVKDFEYSNDGFDSKHIPWGQAPGEYEQYGCLDFYGGDLQGVEQKIQYLKELGVTALYLNPIFDSVSNHKYDCKDYFNVDKHFGGNEALQSLVKKLHENGIKVIVDISINHTGNTNAWFKEKPEYYYEKEDGDFEYWNGVRSLPVLNYTNEQVRNVIYKGEDSVLKHWLKPPYNIDGWRLDVGHNVGKMHKVKMDKEIWRDVRKSIKSVNDEAYIVAEHWTDCSEYLQGDMWDGTMNYFGFMRPVRRYLGEMDKFLSWKVGGLKMTTGDGRILEEEVSRHYGKLPYQLQTLQLNLLSSHDLHRLHNSPYVEKEDVKAAIMMLFTFRGAPCVYYGDEVMLDGHTNVGQGCRYPMEWDEEKWDKDIISLYKSMISLRKQENVLIDGSFKFLIDEGKKTSYCRFNDEEAIIFVNSQENEKSEINLDLETIGEICKVDILNKTELAYEVSNNMLVFSIEPKESLLIKVNLK